MEAKLQRRVQRYGWDAAAKVYEQTWRDNLAPAHDAMFEQSAVKPGERIIDVACGSGLLTFRAAELVGNAGVVTATDISEEMVRLVRDQAQSKGIANVEAVRMEAEALDLPDAAFDAALCGLGLMYVPDPDQAAKEMFRILRPSGRAVAAVWGERRECGWADIFGIVDSVVQSDVCPLFFRLGVRQTLAATFDNAGFVRTNTHRLPVTLTYASERDVLTAMIDGGAVALAAKRFNAVMRHDVERRFLQSIASFRRSDGGYAINSVFVIVEGQRP